MKTKTVNGVRILGCYDLSELMDKVLIMSGEAIPNADWNAKILLLNLLLSNKTEHSKKEIAGLIQNILETMPKDFDDDTLLAVIALPFDENYGFQNNELEKLFADFLQIYAKKVGYEKFIKKYSIISEKLYSEKDLCFFKFINNRINLKILLDDIMEKQINLLCESTIQSDFDTWYYAGLFIKENKEIFESRDGYDFLVRFEIAHSSVTGVMINLICEFPDALSKYDSFLSYDLLKKGKFMNKERRHEFIKYINNMSSDILNCIENRKDLRELCYYRKKFSNMVDKTKSTSLILEKINERILEMLKV